MIPEPLEAASDAPIDHSIADAHDEAAQQAGIDLDIERDAATGGPFESFGQGLDLVGGEFRGRRGRGVGDAEIEIGRAL